MVIYPGLLHSDFILTDDDKNHSWQIWLWKDKDSLKNWIEIYYGNYVEGTIGLHNPIAESFNKDNQHLGNIHFIKDEWDIDVVAHECLHAIFHYIRVSIENFSRILYLFWMEDEEEICYEFGRLVDIAYNWLWKRNPNTAWKKEIE